MNYLDNQVQVKTWYPIIIYSVIDPFFLYKKYCFDIDERKNGYPKLFYKDRVFKLNLTREKAIKLIKNKARIAYVSSEKSARNLVKKKSAMAALSFSSISKEEVIDYVLLGKKFPPKTTRHIIPNRPKNCNVPIEKLK